MSLSLRSQERRLAGLLSETGLPVLPHSGAVVLAARWMAAREPGRGKGRPSTGRTGSRGLPRDSPSGLDQIPGQVVSPPPSRWQRGCEAGSPS